MQLLKPSTNPTIQKARSIYKQTQSDIQNDRLKKFTQQRMKKRYQYLAKQIQRKQNQDDKQDIQELKFYRNKFNSLTVLISESMRESYNKNRFQNQVKNILKDQWQDNKVVYRKDGSFGEEKDGQFRFTKSAMINNGSGYGYDQKEITFNNQNGSVPVNGQHHQRKDVFDGSEDDYGYVRRERNLKKQDINNNRTNVVTNPIIPQQNHNSNIKKSKSPLQQFFESNLSKSKNQKKVNFSSIVPKCEMENSKFLNDLKRMNKRPSRSPIKDKSSSNLQLKNDSRVRDLKRQNQQLQRIMRKRQKQGNGYNQKQTAQQLQKQIYYFKKVNNQLRQQTRNSFPNDSQSYQSPSPYSIKYKQNNVDNIKNRNLRYNTFTQAQQNYQRQKSKSGLKQSKISANKYDNKSYKSTTSSKTQKQKELYINRTPQVLFENQLVKVMVIRYPIKIQQRVYGSKQKLNPQDLCPNEEKLELLVLNNAQKYVKNEQLSVSINYDFDKKYHSVETYRNQNRGYSKKADNFKDIVYSQIVRVKLTSTQGYNEEVKAQIKADFFYNSDVTKRNNRMKQIIDKKENKFSIQVRLPVTFIQFSNKSFSGKQYNSKKIKLTIKPNPLYEDFEHAYINTNLPLTKVSGLSKNLKQQASMYGRSYVHNNSNLSSNGTYIQSQITLMWTQKKGQKFISIYAIQQWAYLLSYMFLDITQEDQQFQQEFRKPSTHVYFNMEERNYV